MEKTIYLLPTDTCFGIAAALDDRAGYHRIYAIKKRSFDKALALMVESFEWLKNYTELSDEQIDFLKSYDRPFTILTKAPYIEMFLKLEDEEEGGFENADTYQEIAFRVAHTDLQKKLIEEVGPIWLTSANYSGKAEIYDTDELEKQFEKYLGEIEILTPEKGNYTLPLNPPSDVFRFGEDNALEYIRKN